MKNLDKALLLSLLAGYTGKIAVLGASPSDAAVVLVLAAAHFAYSSQIQNKKVSDLEHKLNTFTEIQNKQAVELADIKVMTSSMKIAQGLRPTGSR